jgi:prepilin-type N-terminal cleavage/methylation domain-containing protein
MNPLRLHRRRAFTLIEMVVVMGIVLMLAALSVYMLPRIQDNVRVSQAADRLQGWLFNAKQRAKRDGLPTGIRFVYDANNYVGFDPNGTVTQLFYVQQPEDYSQGSYTSAVSATVAQFQGAGLTNQIGSLYPAMSGDYLEIFGGPLRIISGNATVSGGNENLPLNAATTPLDTTALPAASSSAGPNYRIIRQARPLPGEQPLNLPDQTAVYLNASSGTTAGSWGLPTLSGGYLDIVFAPAGNVMNATSPLYCFFVQDTGPGVAAPSLIAITTRSGFIASHPPAPVPPSTTIFDFTMDARDSGL